MNKEIQVDFVGPLKQERALLREEARSNALRDAMAMVNVVRYTLEVQEGGDLDLMGVGAGLLFSCVMTALDMERRGVPCHCGKSIAECARSLYDGGDTRRWREVHQGCLGVSP